MLPGLLVFGLAFGVRSAGAGTAGSLDTTFGTNGVSVTSVAGVVTPSTGGAALGAERLNVDGSQDTSFRSGGLTLINLNRAPGVGSAVLIEPNGNILLGTQLFRVGRRQPT